MAHKISWSDLVSKERLSKNHKSVKEIRSYACGRKFMVKITATNSDDENYQNEIKYLARINHENIVQFYGAITDLNSKGLMALEYADCGSVHDFLRNRNNGISHVSFSCKLSWSLQCAKGLAYLHQMKPPIVHNNLKTRHLLLSNDFQTLKICDFSTAKEITNNDPINQNAEKIEIYDFGVVLLKIFVVRHDNQYVVDIDKSDVLDFINRTKMLVLVNILDILYQQNSNVTKQINWTDLTLKEGIDSGYFGDVFKAVWKTEDGDRNIAVKLIRGNIEDAEQEAKYLSIADHENIVKIFGTTKNSEGRIMIAMEFAECKSLHKFIHSKPVENRDIQVSIFAKLNWMLQCAKGIAHLHNLKILHRDLKPSNLLLFDNYRTLKICDFGTVRPLATMMTNGVGTAPYMAPEVGLGNVYKEKCDVYSFGILCWEIMSQKKPFYHLENRNDYAIINLVGQNERPSIDDVEIDEKTKPIRAWIQQCWNKDPEIRPTMNEMVMRLGIDPRSYNEYMFRELPAISELDITGIPLDLFSKLEIN